MGARLFNINDVRVRACSVLSGLKGSNLQQIGILKVAQMSSGNLRTLRLRDSNSATTPKIEVHWLISNVIRLIRVFFCNGFFRLVNGTIWVVNGIIRLISCIIRLELIINSSDY